ncbi:MAG: hypothetical protein R2911_11125 [Caldilineaceae bacterium]
MLEVAQFMAHTGQFAWGGEVDRVLPMGDPPAQVMRLADYGLQAARRLTGGAGGSGLARGGADAGGKALCGAARAWWWKRSGCDGGLKEIG